MSTIWNASPGAVDPASRPWRRYADAPAAALMSGLRMREFPPSRCQRRYADGSDMLISVVRQGFPSASPRRCSNPATRATGLVSLAFGDRASRIVAWPRASVTIPWAAQKRPPACGRPLWGHASSRAWRPMGQSTPAWPRAILNHVNDFDALFPGSQK